MYNYHSHKFHRFKVSLFDFTVFSETLIEIKGWHAKRIEKKIFKHRNTGKKNVKKVILKNKVSTVSLTRGLLGMPSRMFLSLSGTERTCRVCQGLNCGLTIQLIKDLSLMKISFVVYCQQDSFFLLCTNNWSSMTVNEFWVQRQKVGFKTNGERCRTTFWSLTCQ